MIKLSAALNDLIFYAAGCIFNVETIDRNYMKMKVKKWGNSLALRIPKTFADQTRIKEDGLVNLTLENNKVVITPLKEKKFNLKDLVGKIEKKNLHNEIDFGNSEGNEIW